MRIAICDDEKTYIEKLKNDINSLQTHENEFEFSEFERQDGWVEECCRGEEGKEATALHDDESRRFCISQTEKVRESLKL